VDVMKRRARDGIAAEIAEVQNAAPIHQTHRYCECRTGRTIRGVGGIADATAEPLVDVTDHFYRSDDVGPDRRNTRKIIYVGGGRAARENIQRIARLILHDRR